MSAKMWSVNPAVSVKKEHHFIASGFLSLSKQTLRKDGTDKPIQHTLSTLRH